MRDEQPFICPECGARSITDSMYLSKVYPPVSDDPWAVVLHQVTCGSCHWTIPAHLAYRWSMTIEESRAEWRAVYRATSPNPPESDPD